MKFSYKIIKCPSLVIGFFFQYVTSLMDNYMHGSMIFFSGEWVQWVIRFVFVEEKGDSEAYFGNITM